MVPHSVTQGRENKIRNEVQNRKMHFQTPSQCGTHNWDRATPTTRVNLDAPHAWGNGTVRPFDEAKSDLHGYEDVFVIWEIFFLSLTYLRGVYGRMLIYCTRA